MRLPVSIPIERNRLLARLLCRGDVVALTLRADGRLGIERRDGECMDVDVDPETAVFVPLVVLRYRGAGRVESLVLPQAAVGAENHRRLRVWLRCRAQIGVSVSA